MTSDDEQHEAPAPPAHEEQTPPRDGGEPARREIALPRGCNPLTFGVVMATLEMALILWLWQRCR